MSKPYKYVHFISETKPASEKEQEYEAHTTVCEQKSTNVAK